MNRRIATGLGIMGAGLAIGALFFGSLPFGATIGIVSVVVYQNVSGKRI